MRLRFPAPTLSRGLNHHHVYRHLMVCTFSCIFQISKNNNKRYLKGNHPCTVPLPHNGGLRTQDRDSLPPRKPHAGLQQPSCWSFCPFTTSTLSFQAALCDSPFFAINCDVLLEASVTDDNERNSRFGLCEVWRSGGWDRLTS